MAACANGDGDNAEIGQDLSSQVFCLSDFVRRCVLPECVSVTDGNFLGKSVQISKGDVILLKSVEDIQKITLSFKPGAGLSRTEITVPLDYPQKFFVLPPKEATSERRIVSIVTYPTISDLLLDCPTYFEATASYDDPYLPGCSVKAGDRFRFEGIVLDSKDGVERLKVSDEDGNFVLLSSDCRGNFCPLKDDRQYTIKELVDLAPVQRRLKLTAGDSQDDPGGDCQDEYAQVIKARQSHSPTELASPKSSVLSSLHVPANFTGSIHLHKPETMLFISPFNDPDTVWNIPVSAKLFVKMYILDDYEIPAPKVIPNTSPRVPLPLVSSIAENVPKHIAPSPPQTSQSLVPMKINSFIDCHLPSFPVIAKILDATDTNPFYRKLLKDVDEVNIYRVEEAKRLYVKDAKSDTVFSLSHDLDLSFIEYPVKFKTVLDLLHLPIGSEVKILEDIAADFPKPFSLRVGDIIRITTTNPSFIKMKHAPRDCEVLKCLKIVPEGGDPSKLKLPLDFEMNMVLNVDRGSRKMITLQDLLAGSVTIPTQDVASIPAKSDTELLKELPVDVRILKVMKETFLIVEPTKPVHLPNMPTRKLKQSLSFPVNSTRSLASSEASTLAATAKTFCEEKGSSSSQRPLTNIGLPVSSGILIAYKDRLDIYDLNFESSEADYVRNPMEMMTYSEFEERDRLRKLNDDYEDVEFGSSSTIDETGSLKTLHLMRTGSTGLLERKEKKSKMDKVRRFSKALHPKHWRQSKAEPEPLPHPSAMGLMALAARPHEGQRNDYEAQSSSFIQNKSEVLEADNDDEETHENFYEDVEIGPIKAATFAAPTNRQTGAFSGASHMSLPLPRLSSRVIQNKAVGSKSKAQNVSIELENGESGVVKSDEKSQENNALAKARNWATNLSSKFSKNEGLKFKKQKNNPVDVNKNESFPSSSLLESSIPSETNKGASVQEQYKERISPNDIPDRDIPHKEQADQDHIVPTQRSNSMIETDTKTFSLLSTDISSEPAPKAPKRRKALLKAALGQKEVSSEVSDLTSNDILDKNVNVSMKNDPICCKDTEITESQNVKASFTLANSNKDSALSKTTINGTIEPPRPKPRNLNKILSDKKVSNVPILPPRGEAPPRKKAPETLATGDVSRKPRPPPKPKVSQQSDV
ncbi:hypothetical protein BgiMline_012878 [Biomphalaria glabrata]|nr:hypothetical protein BgiMline_016703 [Biomphalaria glabrata]